MKHTFNKPGVFPRHLHSWFIDEIYPFDIFLGSVVWPSTWQGNIGQVLLDTASKKKLSRSSPPPIQSIFVWAYFLKCEQTISSQGEQGKVGCVYLRPRYPSNLWLIHCLFFSFVRWQEILSIVQVSQLCLEGTTFETSLRDSRSCLWLNSLVVDVIIAGRSVVQLEE